MAGLVEGREVRTREKRRVITSGYAISLGVMKCSKTDCVDGYTTL